MAGQTHTVREFCAGTVSLLGLNYENIAVQDVTQVRPLDHAPVGDTSEARRLSGWQPEVSFEKLVELMMEAGLKTTGEKLEQH